MKKTAMKSTLKRAASITSTTLAFAATLFVFGSSASAHDRFDVPDLDDVEITSVKINGSGCPQGSGASAYFDGDAIVVEAQDMYAIRGNGYGRSEARRICQYIVELDAPEGWTYAVTSVEGATDSYLTRGTTAEAKFTVYFGSRDGKGEAELSRSSSGYASHDFDLEMSEEAYAPCDSKRPLKIKQALKVNGPRSRSNSRQSGFAVTELDGPTSFVLTWKRCDEGERGGDFEF